MGETSRPPRYNIQPDIRDQEGDTHQSPHHPRTDMALKSRTPGESDKHYVSVVSNDDFQAFQQNGYHDDEDIDFSPQNGYYDQEEEEEPRTVVNSKAKKTGAPKVDLMGKIAAAGSAIKNAKLPSPGELKGGYLNSAFHKSLHQPLMVKAKVEKTDVQKARQALTQEKSPTELGNIESLGDIPIPTMRKAKQNTDNALDKYEKESDEQGISFGKSFMEKNIVTAVKENVDPEKLERNMTLTKTKTPAELAQINSITEFPVPEKIKNILNQNSSKVEKVGKEKESKKRRHSDIEPKSIEPFTMYSTLPRSLRETKLVTNVKVEEDEDTLLARKAMVESKSPAELSAIKSLSDLPIPSRVSKIVARNTSQPGGASETKVELASNNKSTSKVNINDMYSTLPKSLKMELAVSVKVNKDPEEVERRKKLCQERTPMELGNIGSLSELPIPAPIQNFFSKSDVADKPDKPKRKSMEEKRKRNLTTGTLLTSDFIPESWKETKLLVRAKVEEDEEVLKSRQQLVETKTPAELGQINGLSDFPVPTRLQTLGRSKKRNLKSTEEKEMSKRVNGSAKSLPDMSGFATLSSSMKCELLVTSKIEDPEIVARNKEIVKNKSVNELSQIRDISDFPVPDGIQNFFKNKQQTMADNEKMSANGSSRPTSPQSFKESIYSTLPRSLKEQQLIVKSKLEDPEKVRERQEIVRTMSPTELSQISSISDLPIPSRVENMLKRKSEPGSPVAPPRKWKTEDIYESLPGSLKSELVVRTREMEDPEELERRREMIRTQTPAQLSEIRSISDLPVPKFIEKIVTKSDSAQTKTEEEDAGTAPMSLNIFSTLPASLKDTKLL